LGKIQPYVGKLSYFSQGQGFLSKIKEKKEARRFLGKAEVLIEVKLGDKIV